ncbi:MAG: hypothetical protein M1823_005688 [Watsoniomyces obsoletus]|nr:MAG: hypothetical protein M1823_005688 [Watsoniomyces obsoletus]
MIGDPSLRLPVFELARLERPSVIPGNVDPVTCIRTGPGASARLWNPINHDPHKFGPPSASTCYSGFFHDVSGGGTWDPRRQVVVPRPPLLRRRPSLCDWDAHLSSADGGASQEALLVSEKRRYSFTGPADYSVMQHSWGEPAREKEGVGSTTQWIGGGAGRSGVMSSNTDPLQGPKMAGLDVERGIRLESPLGGRAALPTSHPNRSQTSLRQTDLLGNGTSTNVVPTNNQPDEFTWGPFHPCFPHPNPHVPLSSPLFSSTRIIRIKRDWMIAGDLAPTFSNLYPEILDPIFPEEQFRKVISKLNNELIAIFNPWTARNWADIVMGALTFWIWDDLGMNAVKRRLFALESWIERWNIEVGAKEGVRIIPLRRTAYMTLDIQIPDPQLNLDPSESNSRPPTETQPQLPEPIYQYSSELQSQPQRQASDSLVLPIMNA